MNGYYFEDDVMPSLRKMMEEEGVKMTSAFTAFLSEAAERLEEEYDMTLLHLLRVTNTTCKSLHEAFETEEDPISFIDDLLEDERMKRAQRFSFLYGGITKHEEEEEGE